MLRILVADRDPRTATEVERVFGPRAATSLEIVGTTDLAAAPGLVERERPAVAVVGSDLLAVEDEEELARRIGQLAPVPVVVLAQPEHAHLAGRILRAGADDWIPRDSPVFAVLPRIVAYATERAQLRRELLRAREKAALAERQLARLFATSPLPLFALDREGRILWAGEAACRLLGVSAGKLEGRPFVDLLGLASRGPFRAEAERITTAEGTVSLPLRLDLADGASGSFVATLCATGADPARLFVWLQPEARHAPGEEERIGQLVREVLDQGRSQLVLARVHLLGLGRIRAVLGQRWPDLERRVFAIVERVLRHHLGPRERWCRVEGGFLLVLPDSDPAEVPERLAELAAAVEAAVLGEEDLALCARQEGLTGGVRAIAELARLDTRAGTVPVSREDTERDDLWEVLDARFRTSATPVSESELLLRRLYREARATHVAAVDRDGCPSPLVLLELDEAATRHVERLLELGERDAEALVELDFFLLSRHLALLERDGFDDTVALVEVHFHTLASRSACTRYLDHLGGLVDANRRLGFLITGVDPGTYAPRLEQALAALRPHGRKVGFQLADVRGVPDLRTARVDLVAIDHRGLEVHPSRSSEALMQCIRRLRRMPGTEILLRGIPKGWSSVLRRRYEVDYTCTA